MAMKPKGLLIDITRCIGCGACSENCKTVNELPPKVDEVLNGDTWTVVEKKGKKGNYVRNLCRHCLDPACVSVCPVSALKKAEYGPVHYDKDQCLGCRYCMMACPFQIPRFEWFSSSPRIRKCILCAPRVKEGKSTGCAEACPTEATVFGYRETLLRMAKARLAAEPERYHQNIYGENEVGGTSVMFLSPLPFEELDFDMDVARFSLPDLTYRILSQLPGIMAMGAGFLGASYWLFQRREKVAATIGADSSKEGDHE